MLFAFPPYAVHLHVRETIGRVKRLTVQSGSSPRAWSHIVVVHKEVFTGSSPRA